MGLSAEVARSMVAVNACQRIEHGLRCSFPSGKTGAWVKQRKQGATPTREMVGVLRRGEARLSRSQQGAAKGRGTRQGRSATSLGGVAGAARPGGSR